ncbi:hypothetical protein EDD27_9576 [Nonomuraea polychroma]|uniref:Uncharacterized protein n=1 Tax=Nonomuraea polychroma TaxID=46176 RepID=A0A438MLP6_9ACTN|nr:hypothetical protein [Nonomuraea polychroma]RVX46682.1 hypothetical protein EDD27_9576 [Nonomuraea polychroma]
MSYDLAVWEGRRPATDEIAGDVYQALMELMDQDGETSPTPRISTYVQAVLERWPALEEVDDVDEAPWSVTPEASGSIVYLCMMYSKAEEVSEFAADLAQEHGLVCYDPQMRCLRP